MKREAKEDSGIRKAQGRREITAYFVVVLYTQMQGLGSVDEVRRVVMTPCLLASFSYLS